MANEFATPDQMADRSNGAIPADRLFLDVALAAASRRIRNYCGWHIYPEVAETDVRVGTFRTHELWLPTTHLVSIEAISNNAVPVDDVASIDYTEGGRVDFYAWARPTLISFTHGFDVIPEDLITLTLELATGELQAAGGAVREQSLASSVTWARTSGKLSDDDKSSLAEYKIGYQP